MRATRQEPSPAWITVHVRILCNSCTVEYCRALPSTTTSTYICSNTADRQKNHCTARTAPVMATLPSFGRLVLSWKTVACRHGSIPPRRRACHMILNTVIVSPSPSGDSRERGLAGGVHYEYAPASSSALSTPGARSRDRAVVKLLEALPPGPRPRRRGESTCPRRHLGLRIPRLLVPWPPPWPAPFYAVSGPLQRGLPPCSAPGPCFQQDHGRGARWRRPARPGRVEGRPGCLGHAVTINNDWNLGVRPF